MPLKQLNCSMEQACDRVVADLADNQIVIGPICWKPSDGTTAKQWYLMLSGCSNSKEWWTEMVCFPPEWRNDGILDLMRVDLMMQLVAAGKRQNKALILHDFDDELRAIKWCETLWPGERVAKVRQGMESERKSPCTTIVG